MLVATGSTAKLHGSTSPGSEPDSEWTLDDFRRAMDQGNVALWSWHPETRIVRLDDPARRLWNVMDGEAHVIDDLFIHIDPRDRQATITAWEASVLSDGPYDFSFRIHDDADGCDATRWLSARGHGRTSNLSDGTIMAVFVDVTMQKEAEEMQRLLVHELGHRIANLFAVASAAVSMSERTATDKSALALDLRQRFVGLRTGFLAVTDETGMQAAAVPFGDILHELATPYGVEDRISIEIPAEIVIAPGHLTHIGLVVHEALTNSIKHGALGVANGKVTLTGRIDGNVLDMQWIERGGPLIEVLPERTGFGTKLMDQTIRAVFGGDVYREVEDGQFRLRFTIDRTRLASA